MKHKGIELDKVSGLERLWGMEYNGLVLSFKAAGWTRADLATVLDIHVTTIAGKVHGRLPVTRGDVWALERLCQMYSIGYYGSLRSDGSPSPTALERHLLVDKAIKVSGAVNQK